MKKTHLIFAVSLLMCALAFNKQALSQNVFIEVEDGNSYRPIGDVRITFESETNTFTFMSDPRGTLHENVPRGLYAITFFREGYETKTIEGFQVSAQVQTLSVALYPGEAAEDRVTGVTATTGPDLPADLFNKNDRRFFLDAGFQAGNVPMFNFGAAYVFDQPYIMLSFSFLNESYQSDFFVSPAETYQISFYDIALGAGYELELSGISLGNSSLFISPLFQAGIELSNTQDLFAESIDYLINYFIKPQVLIGINYGRADFYISGNYMHWLTSGMTSERYGLENAATGDTIEWEPDLFKGRKGYNTQLGIRLSF